MLRYPRGRAAHDIEQEQQREQCMSSSRRKFLGWMAAAGTTAALPKSASAQHDHFAGYPDSYGVLHDTTLCFGMTLEPPPTRSSTEDRSAGPTRMPLPWSTATTRLRADLSTERSSATTVSSRHAHQHVLWELLRRPLKEPSYTTRQSALAAGIASLRVPSTFPRTSSIRYSNRV